MIAQELALRHPRARARAGARLHLRQARRRRRAPDARSSLAAFGGTRGPNGEIQVDLGKLDPMMFFQHLLPTVFNAQFIMTELPKLMQVFSGALQYGFSMDAILAQVAATQGHDTSTASARSRRRRWSSPATATCSSRSTCSDLARRARSRGAKLVKIPGGSHGFNFETPDLFNREVLSFLRSVQA